MLEHFPQGYWQNRGEPDEECRWEKLLSHWVRLQEQQTLAEVLFIGDSILHHFVRQEKYRPYYEKHTSFDCTVQAMSAEQLRCIADWPWSAIQPRIVVICCGIPDLVHGYFDLPRIAENIRFAICLFKQHGVERCLLIEPSCADWFPHRQYVDALAALLRDTHGGCTLLDRTTFVTDSAGYAWDAFHWKSEMYCRFGEGLEKHCTELLATPKPRHTRLSGRETMLFKDRKIPHWPRQNTVPLQIFFWKYLQEKGGVLKRKYIPVFWDHFNCNPTDEDYHILRDFLRTLDPDDAYFVIANYLEDKNIELPPDTLIFSNSGGRNEMETLGKVAIPLLNNPLPVFNTRENRVYDMSFIGDYHAHPCRFKMSDSCHSLGTSLLRNTSAITPGGYCHILEKTVFSLCPRGYGVSSYRLYESILAGCIPVYISDCFWLPYEDKICWDDFLVKVSLENIPILPDIVYSYTQREITRMQEVIEHISRTYFTNEFLCEYIIEYVNRN